jgi:Fur family transcriptional regulator, iron response regulator
MKMCVAAAKPRRGAPSPDDIRGLLHNVGLFSTRQRIALTSLLLRAPNRRVTAEILYDEAHEAQCPVSRATVFNVLRQFEQAGLLRRLTVHRSKKAWFVVCGYEGRPAAKRD